MHIFLEGYCDFNYLFDGKEHIGWGMMVWTRVTVAKELISLNFQDWTYTDTVFILIYFLVHWNNLCISLMKEDLNIQRHVLVLRNI